MKCVSSVSSIFLKTKYRKDAMKTLLSCLLWICLRGIADGAGYSHTGHLSRPHFVRTANVVKKNDKKCEQLLVECNINGVLVPAIVDTGAQISIMSEACVKRCHLQSRVDPRYTGTAIGVGESKIIGRVNKLPIEMGPISFNSGVAILKDSRVEFLIGMDLLSLFESEINVKDGWMKMHADGQKYKVTFTKIPLSYTVKSDREMAAVSTIFDKPSRIMSQVPTLSGGGRAQETLCADTLSRSDTDYFETMDDEDVSLEGI